MTVELSEEEWTRLLNAASLAPYREIAPLLDKAMKQLVAQKGEGTQTAGPASDMAA